jgi:CubicO group peptidase (beta-lactamase class C family)
MTRQLAFLVSVACLLPCLSEARPPAAPSPAKWSAYSQSFHAFAAADGIVGAGIVLVKDGRLVAHHEFGYADREHAAARSKQAHS